MAAILSYVAMCKLTSDLDEGNIASINRWLERGDICLVYENQDMGSVTVGEHRFASYGSGEAQIERTRFSLPPQTMPDIGGQIGWRYQLVGIYSGRRLSARTLA